MNDENDNNLLDQKDFTIWGEGQLYKVILSKTTDHKYLLIRTIPKNDSSVYEFKFALNTLTTVCETFHECTSIDDIYSVLANLIISNKVKVEEKQNKKYIKLSIRSLLSSGDEETFELKLLFSFEDKDYVLNELILKCSLLETEVKNLKKDLRTLTQEKKDIQSVLATLKEDIKNLKSIHGIKDSDSDNGSEITSVKKLTDNINIKNVNRINTNKDKKNDKKKSEWRRKSAGGIAGLAASTDNRMNFNQKENLAVCEPDFKGRDSNCSILNKIKLKELSDSLSNNPNEINFINIDCPQNLKFIQKIGSNNAYSRWTVDKTFAVFKTKMKDTLLVFAKKDNSLDVFDFTKKRITKSVPKAHSMDIATIKHFYDKVKNRDLIITASRNEKNVKIWNIENWACVVNIAKANKSDIFSVCALFDESEGKNYIITSCEGESENLKVWGFNGKISREIAGSNDETYFVDNYNDKLNNRNIIISGNKANVKCFDFKSGQLINVYKDSESEGGKHMSAVIIPGEKVKLVEGDSEGFVRIWLVDTGEMTNKLKVNDSGLNGLLAWNENYVFAGGNDKEIKLIDIKNEKFLKGFYGHKSAVCCLQKISRDDYGDCLVSQGWKNEPIMVWMFIE